MLHFQIGDDGYCKEERADMKSLMLKAAADGCTWKWTLTFVKQ